YFGKIGRVADNSLRYRPDDHRLYWSSIRSIEIGPDNSVWLAGWESRLARYFPEDDHWEIYDSDLSDAQVSDVVAAEDQNGLYWLGTNQGIVKMSSEECHFIPYESELGIVEGEIDPASGDIWWATSNNGGILLNPESSSLSFPIRHLKGRRFSDMQKGLDDTFWFAGYKELIRVFDGERQVISIDELPTATAVGIGPDFRPWIGTNEGIFYQTGQEWVALTSADGLADNQIVDILTASDGTLWVLTKGGISQYSP
ncbi:MAG: two-component regulator propeller domain-containing protein, partial [Chloroflexota bacterium]